MSVDLSISIKQNSQSVANNTSNVTVTVYANYTDGSYNRDEAYGYLVIDGISYDFYAGFNGSGESSGTSALFTKTVNVTHDSDGTKTLDCEAYYEVGEYYSSTETFASKVLTTIPQKSTLSAPKGYLGQEQTLTINAKSNRFTHTITYKCGDESGTIATKTSGTSVKWTPPLSLASQNTVNETLVVTFTLTTYSGNTSIGTYTVDARYTIGTEALPSFTVELSDATGYKDIFGYYIQLRSKLNIKVNATAMYGAEIATCKIQTNNEKFTTDEATTSELSESGELQVYIYIRDSRGKEAQGYYSVSVEAYSPPTVSSLTIKRCDKNGTENSKGEYVQAQFTASVTSLNSKNTASYQFAYKKSANSTYTTVNLTNYNNVYHISDKTYMFAADTGSSYDVQLIVTDAFGSVTKTTSASTGTTIMHFHAKGNGIGLGKVCETENAVDVGWNVHMNGNSVTELGTPKNDSDAVPKGYVDRLLFADSQYPNCLYKTDGTTKYWLNPPMLEGVEYATMELVDNKTVYCKFVKFEAYIMPNYFGADSYRHGITNIDRIIRIDASIGSYGGFALPWMNSTLNSSGSFREVDFLTVNISSDYPDEIIVRYKRPIIAYEGDNEIRVTLYYTKY